MDRDTELLKIQILADSYHSEFTSLSSFIFGLFIAFYIAIVTLVYQKTFDIPTFVFLLMSVLILLTVGLFWVLNRYKRNISSIDALIQHVNRGEPLPSLRELRKAKAV